jgi:hypothetical protein
VKRLFAAFAVALLAGCGAPAQPAGETGPRVSPAGAHRDGGRAWMMPQKKGSVLMYVGDWSTRDVYVQSYPSGKTVGTLTGFDDPYDMCVDAEGDVFVTNFGGENAVKYAHGGTKVLATYATGGGPIGCAVDAKGDVAVTNFSPGEVVVFSGGNPSSATTYDDPDCTDLWPMGYDDKGNLIGVGETTGTISACALLRGATKMTTLALKGITISFPGGTMWDGKYISLGDQEPGATFENGLWPATLRGTTLSASKHVVLSSGCGGAQSTDVSPFVLGKQNTPANHSVSDVVIGLAPCTGYSFVGYWHYRKGGTAFKKLTAPAKTFGIAVSVGT